MLKIYQARSGRLHLRPTCSGAGPARYLLPVRRSESDLQALWDEAVQNRTDPSSVICRCLWRKVPDRERNWRNLDITVMCPNGHPTGRQYPVYEEGVSTGKFQCDVCWLVYIPDITNQTEAGKHL